MDNGKDEPPGDHASETEALAEDEAKIVVESESRMVEEKGEGINERIYTIPLRAVKKAPRWKRSNRAITLIREYLVRHTKAEYIVLDKTINEKVWERGSQKPPSRIRVKVTEEEDVITAELVE